MHRRRRAKPCWDAKAKLTILPLAKVIEPFRKRGPGERRVGVVLADCGELFRLPRFVPDSKPLGGGQRELTECPPPTAVTSAEFATNLTLPRKAPNLGPFKSIKVVDPSVIYLKDGSGATLVELDVELKVD